MFKIIISVMCFVVLSGCDMGFDKDTYLSDFAELRAMVNTIEDKSVSSDEKVIVMEEFYKKYEYLSEKKITSEQAMELRELRRAAKTAMLFRGTTEGPIEPYGSGSGY